MNFYSHAKVQIHSRGSLCGKLVSFAFAPSEARGLVTLMTEAATQVEQVGEAIEHKQVDEVLKPWKRSWQRVILTPSDSE